MAEKNSMTEAYFKAGEDWFTDRYRSVKLQANRWFTAFLGAAVIIALMTIAIIVLLPLKTLIPVVVHQNTTTGEVWVDHPATPYVPATDAQTQADIVHYITARESYTAADINQRFHQVMLLSSNAVAKQYSDEQSNSNKDAPVNTLGAQGLSTVHIEDIVFIDKAGTQEIRHFHQRAENLAKVDFTTTTTDATGNKKTMAWVATIGWVYKGLPQSQRDAWDNWNGFTVTTYRKDPRNVSN